MVQNLNVIGDVCFKIVELIITGDTYEQEALGKDSLCNDGNGNSLSHSLNDITMDRVLWTLLFGPGRRDIVRHMRINVHSLNMRSRVFA